MRFLIVSAGLTVSLLAFSCQGKKGTDATGSADSATQKTEAPITNETEPAPGQNIITLNVGAYPRELSVFDDSRFSARFKRLAGEEYDAMLENFNVETPIVSEGTVFKFTGCRQHNCPGYHTTVLYDAANDNLNLLIEKDGKARTFAEKNPIVYSETLKLK
ncbi:hypothetical protein GCM10023091_36270 [Ravibacter arvi]|uniref:Lipoprotein n=1 Tax=Ravibacter arvi TaxID=2051041 RepID=A0ABP8M9E6_9BACT